jgi:hypothetical protein
MMIKRMSRAFTQSFHFSRPPAVARPPSVHAALPPIGNDVKSLIIQNAKKNLDKWASVWAPALYALATALYTSLLSEEMRKTPNFMNKEAREIVSDYINTWNSHHPAEPVAQEDKNLDALEGLFSPMIAAIKYGEDLKSNKETFLTLLEWDVAAISPEQNSFDFAIEISETEQKNASEFIQIDQYVHQLQALYKDWVKNYAQYKWNPSYFVYQAHRIIENYFNELLLLNLDLDHSHTHWARPEIQQALTYYFDQRELLYKIYAKTAACPWSDQYIFDKIQKMREYAKYIKEMTARSEAYLTTYASFNFGEDRITKFNAALDLYYKTCGIPGDERPERDPERAQSVEAAKTQGRLSKI